MKLKGQLLTAHASLVLADGATGQTTITSAGTATRVFTLPDATTTAVGTDTTQTLSNKTFTAPVLGAATATSINGLTITSSTGTLTIPNSKTLALTTGSLTLISNASDTSATFPASGSITLVDTATAQTLTNKTLTSPNINEAVALTTTATKLNYLTSATGTTGTTSTNVVFSTSPTLVTPVLGNATATSINGLEITSTTATLNIGVGGSLIQSSPYSLTLTPTAATNVTLPTTGTLATLAGSETFTNKTLTSPTLTTPALGVATATSINKVAITAPATSATLTLSDGSSLITSGGHSITLTSSGATNITLPTTGTLITTATAVDLSTAQTLTNKTLTAPIISTISNTGTLTLPTSTDTLVGRATTDTLTNKTLTTALFGTEALPTDTGYTSGAINTSGTTFPTSSISLTRVTDGSTAGPSIFGHKARGTVGTKTVAQTGDVGLALRGYGWDGTSSYSPAASIDLGIDASAGVGDMPGRITFYTCPDSSVTLTERLKIDSAGVGTWATGIKLPSSGGTASTLNFYEENTWTPAPKFGSADATSITLTNRSFTRIGRMVHFVCDISFRYPSSAGNFTIAGLPYTCGISNTPVTLGWMQNVTIPSGGVMVAAVASTSINFYYKLHNGTATTAVTADESEFASTGSDMRVWISGSYPV